MPDTVCWSQGAHPHCIRIHSYMRTCASTGAQQCLLVKSQVGFTAMCLAVLMREGALLNLCCSLAVVVGRCLGAHSLTLTLTHLSVLATTNSTQSNAAPIHRRFHHTRIHTHTYTHSCHLHKNTNTTRAHSTFNEAWQESDRRLRDLAALEADPEQKPKPADRNASIEYVTVHSAST